MTYTNKPYIVFSMVVDIVQRVGSADWVTTPPQCSDSNCVHVFVHAYGAESKHVP